MHVCEMSEHTLRWSALPGLTQHLILHHALSGVRHATEFENMVLAFLDYKDFLIENGPTGNTPGWATWQFERRQVYTPRPSLFNDVNALVPKQRADLLLLSGDKDNRHEIQTWKVQWVDDSRWQCTQSLCVFSVPRKDDELWWTCAVTADATKAVCTQKTANSTRLSVFSPLTAEVHCIIGLSYRCLSTPILSPSGASVVVANPTSRPVMQFIVYDTATQDILPHGVSSVQRICVDRLYNSWVAQPETLHWQNESTLRWLAFDIKWHGAWSGLVRLHSWRVDSGTETHSDVPINTGDTVVSSTQLASTCFDEVSRTWVVIRHRRAGTQDCRICMLQLDPVLQQVDEGEAECVLWNLPAAVYLRNFQGPYAISWLARNVLDIRQIRPRCLDNSTTDDSHAI